MSLFIQSKNNENSAENKKLPQDKKRQTRSKLSIHEMTLFAMFGAMMFISKIVMEFLPNVHLLAMFTVLLTVLYRKKALIPIYIYVFLNGVFSGFNMWWVPYLYIWTVLWFAVMLLPQNMSVKAKVIVYPLLCGLHGLIFGILYAPAQMVMFSLTFRQMLAWILAGVSFDVIHCVSNICAGMLVYPLEAALRKINKKQLV